VPNFEEMDMPTARESIKMRKQLLYGALHDGKSSSLEDAMKRATRAYNWIMTGLLDGKET